MTASLADFQKLDIRAGTVLEAAPLEGARTPAYRMVSDFGPEIGRKQSAAQITALYAPGEIIGRQVAAVVNFPPKRIGGFKSEVLVLGFPDTGGHVVLAAIERPVPNGAKLF